MTQQPRRSSFGIVERSTRLPFAAEAVSAWHTRPGAFERLTPPWERVEVIERGGGPEDAARTVVRVRLGPFKPELVHTHRFTPDGDAGCIVTDRVE